MSSALLHLIINTLIHMHIDNFLGKIRNFIWQTQPNEHKKLISMFLLFFLTSFIYHLLRNMKISLIVTLEGSGANIIPFLTTGYVRPSSIFATYIFTKLSSRYNRETVFYYMTGGFIFYFLLFTFILFPNQDYLQLSYITKFLKQNILTAKGFDGLIAMIRYWNIALFYTMSELWGSVIMIMLIWGFSNETTRINDAKKVYSFFGIGINSAGIFMGYFANWTTSMSLPKVNFYSNSYQWVFYQLLTVLIISITIIILFNYTNKLVFKQKPSLHLLSEERSKISLYECLVLLKKSRYLIYMGIIILSYNIIWNLTEVIWFYRANLIYNDSKLLYAYMNKVTIITGFIAVIFGGLIFSYILRKNSWKYSALITPIVWVVTGILFYLGMLFEEIMLLDIFSEYINNPANLILILVTIQVILGRSCKYTIFDATKEICFIPLSKDGQRKSKAIVDGIVSRLGKFFGSGFYILLLIAFGELSSTTTIIPIAIIGLILLWIYAILKLEEVGLN